MNLNDFNHLREVPEIKFKEESDTTICSYMISTQGLWDIPLAKECRGITFNKQGEVICRPFEKFFNINENPETQFNLISQWNWNDVIVAEKRDGSMVCPVILGDEVKWKTKKSFFSDVALECQAYAEEFNIRSDGKFYESIKRICNDLKQTLIFEFTSLNNKIVLDYGCDPELVLLAVRSNDNGFYVDHRVYAKELDISCPETFEKSLDEIMNEMDTLRNFEGYVLFNKTTQQRVKIKTVWYLQMHRINTDLRERDIVEMILNETVDDLKSSVALEGMSIDPILEIEENVKKDFDDIIKTVRTMAFIGHQMDRKEFAMMHKHHSHFSLAIKEIEGKDPDYKKFFNKYYLKNYSLACVYNKNFSQGDAQ